MMISTRKEQYYAYLESDAWKVLRNMVVRRDSGRCRLCDSSRCVQVHHRKYPAVLGTESTEDLITLCEQCHKLFHFGFSITPPKKTRCKAHTKPKRKKPMNGILAQTKAKLAEDKKPSGGNLNNVTKVVCRQLKIKYPGKGHRSEEDCMLILKRYLGLPTGE